MGSVMVGAADFCDVELRDVEPWNASSWVVEPWEVETWEVSAGAEGEADATFEPGEWETVAPSTTTSDAATTSRIHRAPNIPSPRPTIEVDPLRLGALWGIARHIRLLETQTRRIAPPMNP